VFPRKPPAGIAQVAQLIEIMAEKVFVGAHEISAFLLLVSVK
jgi:hypothetical protein